MMEITGLCEIGAKGNFSWSNSKMSKAGNTTFPNAHTKGRSEAQRFPRRLYIGLEKVKALFQTCSYGSIIFGKLNSLHKSTSGGRYVKPRIEESQ